MTDEERARELSLKLLNASTKNHEGIIAEALLQVQRETAEKAAEIAEAFGKPGYDLEDFHQIAEAIRREFGMRKNKTWRNNDCKNFLKRKRAAFQPQGDKGK